MKKLLIFATIIAVTIMSKNVLALGQDWPVAQNSLNWPTGSLYKTTIFFDHDDSAGVPQTPSECNHQPYKHLGLDIAASAYSYVNAIADGVVKRVGSYGTGAGWYVVVESGNTKKWTTVYGHLNDQGRPSVNTNVYAGTSFVGTVYDMTDSGDTPHLHLGIRPYSYISSLYDSSSYSTWGFGCSNSPNFVDPLVYLTHKNYTVADDSDGSSIASSSWARDKRTNSSLPYPFYFKKGYSSLDATVKNQSFQLNTSIPKDGYYYVYVRWTTEQNVPSNRGVALFNVKQNGNSLLSNYADQSKADDRGRWKKLSQKVYLQSKYLVTVSISPYQNTTGKYVIADAAMIVAE